MALGTWRSADQADLDDWIRRLINDIDSSFPPGPGRETLFDAVKQLTGRYEDLKLRLFGQPVSSLEARWDAESEPLSRRLFADV